MYIVISGSMMGSINKANSRRSATFRVLLTFWILVTSNSPNARELSECVIQNFRTIDASSFQNHEPVFTIEACLSACSGNCKNVHFTKATNKCMLSDSEWGDGVEKQEGVQTVFKSCQTDGTDVLFQYQFDNIHDECAMEVNDLPGEFMNMGNSTSIYQCYLQMKTFLISEILYFVAETGECLMRYKEEGPTKISATTLNTTCVDDKVGKCAIHNYGISNPGTTLIPPMNSVKSVSDCYDACSSCPSMVYDPDREACYKRFQIFGGGIYESKGDIAIFRECVQNGAESFISQKEFDLIHKQCKNIGTNIIGKTGEDGVHIIDCYYRCKNRTDCKAVTYDRKGTKNCYFFNDLNFTTIENDDMDTVTPDCLKIKPEIAREDRRVIAW